MASIFIASIIIGIISQTWKGKTGVVWFFISILLGFIILFLTNLSVVTDDSGFVYDPLAIQLTAGFVTFIIMIIVIVTLPYKKQKGSRLSNELEVAEKAHKYDEAELKRKAKLYDEMMKRKERN